MDYTMLDDHTEDCPSAVFDNDNKYYNLLEDMIENLDMCTKAHVDMVIPDPYQTRILLDWFCETRRRFQINKKKIKK